jgi:hypothetical protein
MSNLRCLTIVFAEFAIMILGVVALYQGVDGAIFVTCVAAISGLGGYTIRKSSEIKNGKN